MTRGALRGVLQPHQASVDPASDFVAHGWFEANGIEPRPLLYGAHGAALLTALQDAGNAKEYHDSD